MLAKDILLIAGVLVLGALGVVLARVRRRRRFMPVAGEPAGAPANSRDGDAGEETAMSELLYSTLRRDLSLAAEHVHSIRWLLEIARQHQQPIPNAALTNLDLVSKHLGEIQRRIERSGEGRATELEFSAVVHHPETRSPLHPR